MLIRCRLAIPAHSGEPASNQSDCDFANYPRRYHSHVKGQYPDGLRGVFIVEDEVHVTEISWEEPIVLSLSDWYQRPMKEHLVELMSPENPFGVEPAPEAVLMNDMSGIDRLRQVRISVEPEKSYVFRLVNMAAFASFHVWIEGHKIEIIQVDGVYTTT